jgi:hypothetical protein
VRIRAAAGAAALAFTFGAPAAADEPIPFASGNEFVRLCPIEDWHVACISYVAGVYDGSQAATQRSICLPDGVDTGQLYEVGRRYILDHPAEAHQPTWGLLLIAWHDAFPCP